MGFPFKPNEEITDAPVEAPVAEETEEEAAIEDAPTADEKKPRKKHNRQATREINQEDITYVLGNVSKMSYLEMAETRGLTKFQINRILMEIKKGLRTNAKGNAAQEEKVETYIKEHLSRPDDAVGRGSGGGKVRNALNNVISDIIGSL